MTPIRVIISIASVLILSAGVALAEAEKGWAIIGGYASHQLEDDTGSTLSTSGLSLGVDFQFPLSPQLSINPFYLSSSETPDSSFWTWASHDVLGAQLRYWIGNLFVGGQTGIYSSYIESDFGSISGDGLGFGAIVGHEWEGGGFASFQYDRASIAYENFTATLAAIRIHGGYRWK